VFVVGSSGDPTRKRPRLQAARQQVPVRVTLHPRYRPAPSEQLACHSLEVSNTCCLCRRSPRTPDRNRQLFRQAAGAEQPTLPGVTEAVPEAATAVDSRLSPRGIRIYELPWRPAPRQDHHHRRQVVEDREQESHRGSFALMRSCHNHELNITCVSVYCRDPGCDSRQGLDSCGPVSGRHRTAPGA
jgi:hypothetical protein